MYNLEVGVFMYKFTNNELPNVFDRYFTKRSTIHNYSTRQGQDFNLTMNKKCFSDHAIRTSGPILWNSLDKSLKTVNSVKYFRKSFKHDLVLNYD